MSRLTDYPFIVAIISFLVLCLSARIGASFGKRAPALEEGASQDFGVIQAGTLTLLGLIIGFSFSMAISRYDLRKTYEEAEANAIGTEYVRADFLPDADAAKVRTLLKDYLEQRVSFYTTRDREQVRRINVRTTELQARMWSAVRTPAAANPTPLTSLVASGMNDVLNSQGYTQAAWWNRIPRAAWGLMVAIAIGACFLLGYGWRSAQAKRHILMILPLVISVSFLLIADIDSPRGGVIRLAPQNLQSLSASLGGH